MTITARDQRRALTDEVGSGTGFAIDVEGMNVRVGRTLAVRELSLHVPWGSVYGLAGPSGAGKSSLLRVLATLQPANAGKAEVNGIDVGVNPAGVRRSVGFLPDSFGLYQSFTTREYLDFCAAIYGVPVRQRRHLTDELLELVDLTSRANQPVQGLSRGMRQQLGLARCLIHDPPILLLDEPGAGMAPRARLELRDILQELRRLGKTILIASNLPGELAEICSHLGVMRDGVLLAEGSIEDVTEAVSHDLHLRIRLAPRDTFAVKRLLDTHPACWQIESERAGLVRARFGGGDAELAALLAQIQAAGISVSEFAAEPPGLDDVVLQLSEVKPES